MKYSPEWFTFWDGPQIATYHENLISCQKP